MKRMAVLCISVLLWMSSYALTYATAVPLTVLHDSFGSGIDGQLLSTYDPWYDANAYLPQGQSNNNIYTIRHEQDNGTAQFYKGPETGTSRLWAARSLNVPQGAKKITVSFKVRLLSSEATQFEVGFRAADRAWHSNGHIRFFMGTSTIRLLRADGSNYDTYNKLTATVGEWNTVTATFDTSNCHVKVNGKSSGSFSLASAKALLGDMPSDIAFGFQREQAVGSTVELDDLIVTAEQEGDVLVSQPTFYLNYGKASQTKLSAFAQGEITGSVAYYAQTAQTSVVSLMAVYNEKNQLLRVTTASESMATTGESGRVQCSVDTNGGASAKLFVWSSLTSCQPILNTTLLSDDDISGAENVTLMQPTQTYYVSPNGSDENSGTAQKPFKSLAMAAQTAEAGSTVILADGVYRENRQTVVRYSGSETAPIVFKAQNPLAAQVIYPQSTRLQTKFLIEQGTDYITLQGLSMTQEATATETDSNKTSDILYACYGDHCSIIGNKLYHAYEEGIKFYLAKDIVIADNIISDTVHEAIDLVNCDNIRIYNNDLSEFGRIGVFGKGGTRNMLVYNNYIHNKERHADVALGVGGSTDARWSYDVAEGTGYENYNSVYYNNIIHAESDGAFLYGIGISAPKNAYIYNNIVLGADYGYCTSSGGGIKKGWPWWPGVDGVDMKNNIFYQCGRLANETLTATNFSFTNNLLWQTAGMPKDGLNIEGDPLFVDPSADWHVQSGSPAISTGTAWPEFKAYGGGTLNVERLDYSGEPYGETWNIGIYR